MIIRVFRAHVKPGKHKEFERMVKEISIPLVRRQKGLVACYSGKPIDRKSDEFIMVTIWADLASLKTFAGEKWQEAVIPAKEERDAMREWFVHHYESLE